MSRIGYVLKVYPRFSETFIVTEILAREAAGEQLSIYALRPTTDSRFHPEIARVNAPVAWIPRHLKGADQWVALTEGLEDEESRKVFSELLPVLAELPGDEVVQGITLARAVRRDGITHLHAHFASLAGRVAWIASRLSGVPYTVTTHAKDIFHESVDRAWLRRICADAHRVIAISRYNEKYLDEVLEGTHARVDLLHNGIELGRFPCESIHLEAETFSDPRDNRQDAPLRIIAVGRLVPKKGFDDLLDALILLRQRGSNVSVDLVGEGELGEHLARRVQHEGLEGHVRFLGPRTQNEVRDLLRAGDVFVAPCRIAEDGNMDGLPTVVLEAMATGIPVIATAVTGLPEVIRNGQTGILLESGDIRALADAIDSFVRGRPDAHALVRRARALVEKEFDASQQAQQLRVWESEEREEK